MNIPGNKTLAEQKLATYKAKKFLDGQTRAVGGRLGGLVAPRHGRGNCSLCAFILVAHCGMNVLFNEGDYARTGNDSPRVRGPQNRRNNL